MLISLVTVALCIYYLLRLKLHEIYFRGNSNFHINKIIKCTFTYHRFENFKTKMTLKSTVIIDKYISYFQ